jgi:hypothetical protein
VGDYTRAQRCRVHIWRIIVVRDVAVVTMMQGVCELESVRVEECGGYGSLYCTNGSREERQRKRDRQTERELMATVTSFGLGLSS